jgi:hypothetical protein
LAETQAATDLCTWWRLQVHIRGLPWSVGLAALVAVIRARKDDLPDIVRILMGKGPRDDELDAAFPAPAQSHVAGRDERSQAFPGRGAAHARAAWRRVLIWLGTVATGVLIAVLGALIANYLSSSHPAIPAHRATPNVIASTRR